MTEIFLHDNVRLYILMRNDMQSLNPGKAVAQGAHAANLCVATIARGANDAMKEQLAKWEASTSQHFGTTIVLSASIVEIRKIVGMAKEFDELHAGIVHDPTYPLNDGETLHLIPLDTCGFVFGPTLVVTAVIPKTIQLMP